MHTVHLAEEERDGFKYAAMGLMFSVQDYDRSVSDELVTIIDKFFDSMSWDSKDVGGNYIDPVVAEVPYGDLMMAVDMHNRWVYKGSVTTPPCAQSVYWNVLKTVYPIKSKHLYLFKDQMKARGSNNLQDTGSWRVTSEIDEHDVIVVSTETSDSAVYALGWILIVLSFTAVILVGYLYTYVYTEKQEEDKAGFTWTASKR